MKRLLLFCIVILVIGIFGFNFVKNTVRNDLLQPVTAPVLKPTITPVVTGVSTGESSRSIFVPYWAVDSQKLAVGEYTQVIYFGVAASSSGSIQEDSGLTVLPTFSSLISGNQQTLLTLRMINADANFALLKDSAKQNSLMNETTTTARNNGFKGVVLYLELSALPFDAVVKQIDDFVARFSGVAKQKGLSFSLLMYGDTFYRLRPFDVKFLGEKTDGMMIMAYDFSKANADPGPNFPLAGQETYGYDMQKMIADFLHVVPADKLTVIFGRFGYDWTIDDAGHSLQAATPLTDSQIQNKFLSRCVLKECILSRDPLSAESRVTYTDDSGKKHVVWFEDQSSADAKEKYLLQQGISHFSDWAYSYFPMKKS